MKSFKRVTLCVIMSFASGTLITSLAQTNPPTFTISGKIDGLGGVEMRGLPGNVVTDENGSYSASVEFGWSGTVRPVKSGYTFDPASISYTNLTEAELTQDFKAERITLTISGSLGLEGVVMNGLPGNPVTDSNGRYSVQVPFGWAGTVKPFKDGYAFEPPVRIYSAVSSNLTNQDYAARVLSFIISGNTGVPGVQMRGLPDNAVSGPDGSYSATVKYGWSGKIFPIRKGYEFSPPFKEYTAVNSNYTNQDYKATENQYTMTGSVGMEGVRLIGLPQEVYTDSSGFYSATIPYGWSGKVQPVREGYTFSPPTRQYSAVTRDMTNQNYTAKIQMLTISDTIKLGEKPFPGVSITANPGDISTVTDVEGQYSLKVPYGWNGEIILSKPGIKFSPDSKSYKTVTTDIINGIPVAPKAPMGFSLPLRAPAPAVPQANQRPGRKILILPFVEIDLKDIAETREDISIMAEILDERFREPQLIGGVLRDFGDFFGRDNQHTEAIYIQGYGLIFMMEVNYRFLLLSQSQAESKPQTNHDSDKTWEQARQRVLSTGTRNTAAQNSEAEYEKQMVNILTTELLRTLKYAVNIRNMKPDEWVILSVRGAGSRSKGALGWEGSMTMRVKKSEVNSLASGELDFEQFREKVQILMN